MYSQKSSQKDRGAPRQHTPHILVMDIITYLGACEGRVHHIFFGGVA